MMVSCTKIVIILLLLSSAYEVRGTITAVVSTVVSILKIAKKIWEMIEKRDANEKVMDQLKYLSEKSDMLAIDMTTMIYEIGNDITENVPGLVEINRRLSKVHLNTLSVGKSYQKFMHYIEDPEKYDSNIVKDFAFEIISDGNNGLDHLLEEIHGLMVKNSITSQSTINLLIKHMEVFLRYIDISKSPQQLLSDLFDSIIYTELKGRLTILFSYQFLEKYQPGKYKNHIKISEDNFINRINKTVSAFKTVAAIAPREVWKNDPAVHLKDITYTQLNHVFQEYIVNEYNISTYDKCYLTCPDYKVPTGKLGYRCYYDSEICAHQRVCKGYLYNCRKQFSSTINICPSQTTVRSLNFINQRYEYIEFNGQRYGPKEEKCVRDIIKADNHFSHPFLYCDSCMCICDDVDDENSDRFFNLESSMARIQDNYVITGARFVKENHVIHIEIQEGYLLPNGLIDKNTIVWAPINKNPKKLYKLRWDESRAINLDDLQAPENHVLVGLSFYSEYSSREREYLQLKIFSSPVNFTSGTLISNNLNQETIFEMNRDELNLANLDIPTRSAAKNDKRSKPNEFLNFVPSSLEYDVGQSTIPFIDTQEIITEPPMPMSGAGIYHRSRKGSGGFIALKLFTYNIEPYLGVNLPKIEDLSPIPESIESKIISDNTEHQIISNSIDEPEKSQHQWRFNHGQSIISSISDATKNNEPNFLTITILIIIVKICYWI